MATYFNNVVPPLECEKTFDDFEWDSVYDIQNVSYTKSYYPDSDTWFSYHDYIPKGIFKIGTKLVSIDDDNIYEHNVGNRGKYYKGIYYKSLLSPVLKSPYRTRDKFYPAIFTAIHYRTDFIKDKKVLRNVNFSRMSFHNSYQSSNKIDIVPFDSKQDIYSQYDLANVRLIKNNWSFNNFRSLVANNHILNFEEWSTINDIVFNLNISEGGIYNNNLNPDESFEILKKMNDEYMIILIEFDNTSENIKFVMHDITFTSKHSVR